MKLLYAELLVLVLLLPVGLATAEVPQLETGEICYSLMFGPEVVGNGRIVGLAPGAPEELKARIHYIHVQNELRRLQMGGGPMSLMANAIELDGNRRYCKGSCGGNGHGGNRVYQGLWVGHCSICNGANCTATCWQFPGGPPCPPPC